MGKRVVSFGECMLELQGQAFGLMQQSFGGDTLNLAVYLARCGQGNGLQVDYATALGDDSLSDGLISRWQAEGLGTGLVRRLPGRLPGLYLIELDAGGERRFCYWRDRSAARDYFETAAGLTPLEQHADELDALVFSGISLTILPPAGRQRLLEVARRVRERHGLVAFDNNFRPRLWPDAATARQAHADALAVASCALLTLDDEQLLWQQPDAARQLQHTLASAAPELVVKRGAAPTLVRTAEGKLHEVPTEAVAHVVDTTAAGDAFAGAYLAGRLAGAPPEEAARMGNRLAARVIQHPGAILPLAGMADLVNA